jgi:hypothetical protein
VVLVVIALVVTRRVRRRPDPASWAETGDNRLFGRPPAGDGPDDQVPGGSRLWSASDWSLPREPDEAPVEPAAGGTGTIGDVLPTSDEGARAVDGERPASDADERPASDADERPAGDPPPGP